MENTNYCNSCHANKDKSLFVRSGGRSPYLSCEPCRSRRLNNHKNLPKTAVEAIPELPPVPQHPATPTVQQSDPYFVEYDDHDDDSVPILELLKKKKKVQAPQTVTTIQEPTPEKNQEEPKKPSTWYYYLLPVVGFGLFLMSGKSASPKNSFTTFQ